MRMVARRRIPDGMGLVYAMRLGGTPIREAVHGRLLPEAIVPRSAPDTPPFALLGGRDDAPAKAADYLRSLGATVVAAASPPMGFEIGGAQDQAATQALVDADPQIVIVGLGAPKQEMWMARHASDLPNAV